MSLTTFLVLVPAVVLLAMLVRAFWIEIAAVILIIRILFNIAVLSFGSALVWAIGIENDKEGFWLCWVFFAIVYTVAAGIFYLIANDIVSIGVNFVRKIFKVK